MNQDKNQQEQPDDAQPATPDPQPRSENLLPGDDADDDGRFDIAEEVNLDQQSDALHHIGNLPDDSPADALAGTLRKD